MAQSSSRKRRKKRRGTPAGEKVVVLLNILWPLCLIVAGVMLVTAWVQGGLNHRMQRLILGYVIAGVILMLIRVMFWLKTLLTARLRRQANRDAFSPDAGKMKKTSGRSGFALPLVLLFLVLISVILVNIQTRAHLKLRQQAALVKTSQLETALVETLSQVMRVLADDEPEVDGLRDTWNIQQTLELPNAMEIRIRVTDQNRFLDLNNLALNAQYQSVPEQVLMDLFTLQGDFNPVEKVEALRDWIDEDDEGYTEDLAYLQSENNYTTPDRPMLQWAALTWMFGFTEADLNEPMRYEDIEDVFEGYWLRHVTIIPASRKQLVKLNINTADRQALQAVFGVQRDYWVNLIMTMRDIKPFISLEGLAASVGEPLFWEQVQRGLDVKSRFFRVDLQGFYEGAGRRGMALLERNEQGDVHVLQYVM